MNLTEQEIKAIRALKRVAGNWPDTLWLFVEEGCLNVMRFAPDGSRILNPDGYMARESSVAVIDIHCDGGEW